MKFVERNYQLEKSHLLPTNSTEHPLISVGLTRKNETSNQINKKNVKPTPSYAPVEYDPLSGDADFGNADPLSFNPVAQMQSNDSVNQEVPGLEPWSSRRTSILSRYTTTERLSIVSSFLTAQTGDHVKELPTSSNTYLSEGDSIFKKVRSRLEQTPAPQMDPMDFVESCMKELSNLTAQDFTTRVQELQSTLLSTWDTEQRVRALQIVIQCTKLLSNTSDAIQFYPSKFVLITDVLDTFGDLVFSRLKAKSSTTTRGSRVPIQLGPNFNPDQVPEVAKETARNWFFKIASIRELLPRLYVEAAILSSYRFLNPAEIPGILLRLMHMTRGIGDPLVGAYARCYLVRVGMQLAPHYRDHLKVAFQDFLLTSAQVTSEGVGSQLAAQNVTLSTYFTLFLPSLDWILHCLCLSRPDMMQFVLNACEQNNNGLLLNSVMSSFAPHFIGDRAKEFVAMIQRVDDDNYPKHLLYHQLGVCLTFSPPAEESRSYILREVWKAMSNLVVGPKEFCSLADAWVEFIVRFFSHRQLAVLLADVIRQVSADEAYESLYPQLLSILHKILSNIKEIHTLFDVEEFMRFLDLFARDHVRMEAFRSVLETVLKQKSTPSNKMMLEGGSEVNSASTPGMLSDPVTINAFMSLARRLHDSFNALTAEDNRRVLSKIMVEFISLVDYGDQSVDKLLDWYTDCRGTFYSLESVIELLVMRVNALAARTHRLRGGNHTTKTSAFVRACCAFSFITIPSLNVPATKLELYLLSGQVALMCGCLGQADANFKSAITLLHECNKNNVPLLLSTAATNSSKTGGRGRANSQAADENFLVRFMSEMASSLIMCPDGGASGVYLYLFNGLLNVLQHYSFLSHTSSKGLIYCQMLTLLANLSQPVYAYHADKTQANDSLYGWSQEYLEELDTLFATLLEQLGIILQELSAARASIALNDVAERLAITLLMNVNLEQDEVSRNALKQTLQYTAMATGKAPKGLGAWITVELDNLLKRDQSSPLLKAFAHQCLSVLVG